MRTIDVERFCKDNPNFPSEVYVALSKAPTIAQGDQKELVVQTPLGDIVVDIKDDESYPGVCVDLRGGNLNDRFEVGRVRLAWVEYSPDRGCIQTIVYGDGNMDDYTHRVEHENVIGDGESTKKTKDAFAQDLRGVKEG